MSGFEMVTCSRISTILEIQLGKMLHSYKKTAANQGALYDSKKRDEIRKRLRTILSLVYNCFKQILLAGIHVPPGPRIDRLLRLNPCLLQLIIARNNNIME